MRRATTALATFAIGAISGALVRPFVGLVARDAVKATIKAGFQLKKLVDEVVEDYGLTGESEPGNDASGTNAAVGVMKRPPAPGVVNG